MVAATAVLAVGGTVAIRSVTEPTTPQLSLPLDETDDLVLRLPDEAIPPSLPSVPPPPSTRAGPTPDASGGTATTSASSTTLALDSATSPYAWRRLLRNNTLAPTGAASGLAAVVAVEGQGLIAVGNAGGLPVVLVSADATGWSRVPEGERSLGRGVLRDLAIADGVLLAVGSDGGRPAAWSSIDARSWTPVPVSVGSDRSGRGLLGGIAVAPDGIVVAVGFEPGGVGVWTFGDSGFEPVPPPDDSTGGQTFADVAFTAAGFVAGGNDGAGRPVVWTSPRGDVWHRAEVHDDGRSASIAALTSVGDAIVAVGYDDAGPKAWVSVDVAATWSLAGGPTPTPGRPQSLLSVADTPAGAIAAGQGDSGPLCWSTTDGMQWAECSPPGDLEFGMVRSLTPIDTGLVAVGSAAETGYEAGLGIWLIE